MPDGRIHAVVGHFGPPRHRRKPAQRRYKGFDRRICAATSDGLFACVSPDGCMRVHAGDRLPANTITAIAPSSAGDVDDCAIQRPIKMRDWGVIAQSVGILFSM
jgi:hypothetical protein